MNTNNTTNVTKVSTKRDNNHLRPKQFKPLTKSQSYTQRTDSSKKDVVTTNGNYTPRNYYSNSDYNDESDEEYNTELIDNY